MSTFVSVPADRLLNTLRDIGQKIADKGGRYVTEAKKGSEIVAEIALPPSEKNPQARSEFIVLKVYTSIEHGQEEARAVGEDAIRIVVGSISTGEFKPVRDSVTIKRTAPNDVNDRVAVFLERFTLTLRDSYRFGLSVPLCICGHHMALRKGGRSGTGKAYDAFWGCTTYPACRGTKKI